jgi:MoxR-like ATPase
MRARVFEDSPDVVSFAENFQRLVHNIEIFIRGKRDAVVLACTCLFAEGHLLIEDVPGLGKTSLAKSMASSFDGSCKRLQFTPDLLPSDVTGVTVYDQHSGRFEFHPGAVFANVVLVDEINRASPKTQSALLEVMEERQVTMDSVSYSVQPPFTVLATQNPIEMEGTYRLPEAQIDRFLMVTSLGYPTLEAEIEVMENRANGHAPELLGSVLGRDDVLRMIETARDVFVAPALRRYIVSLSAATRHRAELRLGVSPRGSIALEAAARVRAAADGRPFVTADDVKALAQPVLAHRLLLRPEAELDSVRPASIIDSILASVPVPRGRADEAAT